jgi:hypothetical protein
MGTNINKIDTLDGPSTKAVITAYQSIVDRGIRTNARDT